jgi:hypothetical protein
LTAVVIRASDTKSLSEFWTEVLGADAVSGAGGLALEFVPADGPKRGKNRVHLDLKAGPEQLERLLRAGAVRADIGQGAVDWEVLADPEGNEFCLQPGLQEGVRWSAVCQDAAGPGTQRRFWAAAAYGWTVVSEGEWGFAMAAEAAERAEAGGPGGPGEPGEPGDPSRRGPLLVMGPPATAKDGPNRLYLRVAPNRGSDVAVEASRLVAAGATRDTAGGGLMLDPEGNEFLIG